jgi:hypothetical protein
MVALPPGCTFRQTPIQRISVHKPIWIVTNAVLIVHSHTE